MADTNPEKRATDDLQIEQGPVITGNLHEASLDDKALNIGAIAGTEAEHSYGVWQGLKTYKRAALWSIGMYTMRQALMIYWAPQDSTALTQGPHSHLQHYHHGGLRRDPHRQLLRLPCVP